LTISSPNILFSQIMHGSIAISTHSAKLSIPGQMTRGRAKSIQSCDCQRRRRRQKHKFRSSAAAAASIVHALRSTLKSAASTAAGITKSVPQTACNFPTVASAAAAAITASPNNCCRWDRQNSSSKAHWIKIAATRGQIYIAMVNINIARNSK
jgi:cell division septation protein DedD